MRLIFRGINRIFLTSQSKGDCDKKLSFSWFVLVLFYAIQHEKVALYIIRWTIKTSPSFFIKYIKILVSIRSHLPKPPYYRSLIKQNRWKVMLKGSELMDIFFLSNFLFDFVRFLSDLLSDFFVPSFVRCVVRFLSDFLSDLLFDVCPIFVRFFVRFFSDLSSDLLFDLFSDLFVRSFARFFCPTFCPIFCRIFFRSVVLFFWPFVRFLFCPISRPMLSFDLLSDFLSYFFFWPFVRSF